LSDDETPKTVRIPDDWKLAGRPLQPFAFAGDGDERDVTKPIGYDEHGNPLYAPRGDPASVNARLIEGRCPDVAARVGSHEHDEQTRESVWHPTDAPQLQRYPQMRSLLVVEMNRPARSDCVELLNDRVATGDGFELLKQRVPLVPADLDDLARYVDLHPVEALGHCELLAAGALAGFDAYDVGESNELRLSRVELNPAALIGPPVTVDDGHDRGCIVALGFHSLGSSVGRSDPDSHGTESRP
jgi:hypothetical protein